MNENVEMFGGAQQRQITKCPHCGSEIISLLGGLVCTACDFRISDQRVDLNVNVSKAHARRADPETSHAAAAGISTNQIRESQKEVWALFRHHGSKTDRDMVYKAARENICQSPSGLRTRRDELVTMGKLQDSGQRTMYDGNRKHIVWELI